MKPFEYNLVRHNVDTATAHHITTLALLAQDRLSQLGYNLALDGKWGPSSQYAAALMFAGMIPRRVDVSEFLELMRSQLSKPYEYGAKAACDDPDPPAYDCAEIIRWSGCRLSLDPAIPDGSWLQLQHCASYSLLIDVTTARSVKGALLYSCASREPIEAPWGTQRPQRSHVAVSLGNGRTIEARPSNGNAVSEQPFDNRGWRYAALIPGLAYEDAR